MGLRRPSRAVIYDCVILGAGPAGMAAAVQLQRSGFQILVLEKNEPGGLLRNAHQVENYLGHLKIPGKHLVNLMKSHLKKWRITWRKEEVLKVRRSRQFEVHTQKQVYLAKTVLVATGTKPKKWNLERDVKVFYDWASLQPQLKKHKRARIGVIGGGDLAFDFALHLKEQGHEPLVFIRNRISCLPLLRKRAQKLQTFENTEIKSVKKQGETMVLASTKENFTVDFVLVAIGREPLLPPLPPQATLGLYFAGDVHGGKYRQASIAAGDGLKAAMQISEYLSAQA